MVIDAREIVRRIVVDVEVRVVHARLVRLRLWLGMFFVRLGVWIGGITLRQSQHVGVIVEERPGREVAQRAK